jgi:serine/threonine-protein kinase
LDGSEREFRRAIELNPNNSETHRNYSHYLDVRKRFAEALEENRRAIDLDPLDILNSMHVAWLDTDAHEGAKAVEQSKRVLEMDPAFTGAYLYVARGYELQGKWPEAIAAYEKTRDVYDAVYLAGVAHAWAASGNRRQAEAALLKLQEFSKQNHVSPLSFAGVLRGTRRSRPGVRMAGKSISAARALSDCPGSQLCMGQSSNGPAIPIAGTACRVLMTPNLSADNTT